MTESHQEMLIVIQNLAPKFARIARPMIEAAAEQEAEKYTSVELKLEEGVEKERVKMQFIGMFIEQLKWLL